MISVYMHAYNVKLGGEQHKHEMFTKKKNVLTENNNLEFKFGKKLKTIKFKNAGDNKRKLILFQVDFQFVQKKTTKLRKNKIRCCRKIIPQN